MLKKIKNFFLTTTLKVSIITIFLSIISTAFVLVISFTYFQNSRSLTDFSRGVIERASEAVVSKLHDVALDMQETVAILPAFFVTPEEITLQNKTLIALVIETVQQDPNIASFFMSGTDGTILQGGNLSLSKQTHLITDPDKPLPKEAKFWVRLVNRSKTPFEDRWEYKDANLNTLVTEVIKGSSFDATKRPWYIGAIHTEGFYWTAPYQYYETNELGLTVALKILNEKNEIIGVTGVDLSFVFLSKFLMEQKIGKTGSVFIIDKEGKVLLPTDTKLKDPDISLLTVKKAYQLFSENKEKGFTFKESSIRYMTYVNPISEEFGNLNDWSIVVIARYTDFFANLLLTQKEVVIITLCILVVSAFIVFYSSKKISEPIVVLSNEIRKIEDLDLSSELNVKSRIKEINLMNRSIASMRVALRSFTRYVPKEIVKQLIYSGKDIVLGGEKKEITIVFSDIEGFTPIAETHSTESLMELLAEYFRELSEIFLEGGATIDKYIGDSIMAFWGAPLPMEKHSIKACRAVLRCHHCVLKINSKRRQQNQPEFRTRFGMHVGTVIVGNIGTLERMNYTIIGDAVNLAARLQQVSKEYHIWIIISEEVYKRVKDDFLARPLDEVSVKGKKEKTKIYELMGALKEDPDLLATKEQIELCLEFTKGIEAYQRKDIQTAKEVFESLIKKFPEDYPTQLYLSRLRDNI